MSAPCRHCGDADASQDTGLCVPCERDDGLATPGAWPLLGARLVIEENACGRPLVGVGVEQYARLEEGERV